MAKNGQRRMLFDIRGKRRHVVRAVYAVLAALMAGSLFLVVGPVNLGEVIGGGSSGGNGAEVYEEKAERLERDLRKDPQDEKLLQALTRARINAGNSLYEVNAEGQPEPTPEALQQLQLAGESWDRYLKATDEPSVGTAQLMANSLIVLAQNPRTPSSAQTSLEAATEAQEIVAEKRPSLNALTTLAFFRAYLGEGEEARRIGKKAERYTYTKTERDNVKRQLKEAIKAGVEFQKYVKSAEKQQREEGKERKGRIFQSENPLGGVGGTP